MQIEPGPRTSAYIDGFNFYHGLMAKEWGRYRWLDFWSLMDHFARGSLQAVKYFTTRAHEAGKRQRQETYLRALELQGVTVIEGVFEMRHKKCSACDTWVKYPQEKRTDVNIATHLVADAFDGLADTVILVSADSDLVPAVQMVKSRFNMKVVLIDPPRRHCGELAQLADAHLHFSSSALNQNQLADPFEFESPRGKKRKLFRPESWC